jgi:hypothetical protein
VIENPIIANPGLRAGQNVMLTVNSRGISVNARSVGGNFKGYYGITLGTSYCLISAGTVQSRPLGKNGPVTPKIGGVPIGGTSTAGSPKLALTSGVVDPATGVSYVTLEVQPNADGTLDSTSVVRVDHLGVLTPAPTPKSYLQPLAIIQWRNGRPWKATQIVFFNQEFFLFVPPVGNGAPVPFFTPV